MANSNSKDLGKNNKNTPKNVNIRIVKKKSKVPSILVIIAVSILLTLFINFIINMFSYSGEEVGLSQILTEISDGTYDKVVIKDDIINLEYTDDNGDFIKQYALISGNTDFYSVASDAGIDVKSLENVYYEPKIAITFGDILTLVMIIGAFVLGYIFIKNMQGSGGQIFDFGQSKARLMMGKKSGTNFDDVAGIDEVKEELKEIVDFLKYPKKYSSAGARIPKGVLLAGAPGTGKTLLAKAVAGEAGVPFFHSSGSEFEEMLVGAGASRVRDLFNKARKAAPCIIFIDEIDAVAKKRGTVLHSGAGEQTLNQILVEMDGLEERTNVIVLAATNRPDVLDPAILRPGRFDRTVVVPMPDFKGRKEILEVHAKNKKFEENVNLEDLAKKTIGYSGADLENLLNEAAIMAALENRKIINREDIAEAYLKVKLGRKKRDQDKDEEDIKTTAYHEAGHAIVAKFTPYSDPIEQVSIISRGMAGGVTVYLPEKDTKHLFKDQILAHMRSGVAGRAAEELFIGRISTGASSDIENVTEMAREMVTQYGMSDDLGMVKYGDAEETKHLGYNYGGGRAYSEEYAKKIDDEVKNLVDGAYREAKKILEEHKGEVEKLVKMLLEKEVVTGEEFESIF
ncbi:MAG: ATP-dependent zinc metalloprotease FtsH [Candidatus Dojkabacteria bacterium]|nr:ATP-dependent zinc metalloprotease FtsH [Candidatus Dojkabacteria bacterium]